jgi:hypothetical protein
VELKEFEEVFERLKEAHEIGCARQLSEDPTWELMNPIFFLVMRVDGEIQLISFPLPEGTEGLPVALIGGVIRHVLKVMVETPPEELAKTLKDKDTGKHPEKVEVVAFATLSEGWEKDPETLERKEEISFAVLEDREYHVGNAAWTKDVEKARLVPKHSCVDTALHDAPANLSNMFGLAPREENRAN